jgi:hypothetical protein
MAPGNLGAVPCRLAAAWRHDEQKSNGVEAKLGDDGQRVVLLGREGRGARWTTAAAAGCSACVGRRMETKNTNVVLNAPHTAN